MERRKGVWSGGPRRRRQRQPSPHSRAREANETTGGLVAELGIRTAPDPWSPPFNHGSAILHQEVAPVIHMSGNPPSLMQNPRGRHGSTF